MKRRPSRSRSVGKRGIFAESRDDGGSIGIGSGMNLVSTGSSMYEDNNNENDFFSMFSPKRNNRKMKNLEKKLDYYEKLKPDGYIKNLSSDDDEDGSSDSESDSSDDDDDDDGISFDRIVAQKRRLRNKQIRKKNANVAKGKVKSVKVQCTIDDDMEVISIPGNIDDLHDEFSGGITSADHHNCIGCRLPSQSENMELVLNEKSMTKIENIMTKGMETGNIDGASKEAEKVFDKFIAPCLQSDEGETNGEEENDDENEERLRDFGNSVRRHGRRRRQRGKWSANLIKQHFTRHVDNPEYLCRTMLNDYLVVIKNMMRYNLVRLRNEGPIYRTEKGLKKRKMVKQLHMPTARVVLQSMKEYILLKLKVKKEFLKKEKSSNGGYFNFFNKF